MEDLAPEFEPLALENGPFISFEEASETLIVDQVEIRLDTQLGDDELGVSLLVESLEEQYRELVMDDCTDDSFLTLQSTKEWVLENRDRLAGLFRYLKTL